MKRVEKLEKEITNLEKMEQKEIIKLLIGSEVENSLRFIETQTQQLQLNTNFFEMALKEYYNQDYIEEGAINFIIGKFNVLLEEITNYLDATTDITGSCFKMIAKIEKNKTTEEYKVIQTEIYKIKEITEEQEDRKYNLLFLVEGSKTIYNNLGFQKFIYGEQGEEIEKIEYLVENMLKTINLYISETIEYISDILPLLGEIRNILHPEEEEQEDVNEVK